MKNETKNTAELNIEFNSNYLTDFGYYVVEEDNERIVVAARDKEEAEIYASVYLKLKNAVWQEAKDVTEFYSNEKFPVFDMIKI